MPPRGRQKLGEILVTQGILTQADLDRAVAEQRQKGKRLGYVLLDMGLIKEEDLLRLLALQLSLKHVDLEETPPSPDVVQLIPESLARRHLAVPVKRERQTLVVAMADPLNIIAIDEIGTLTRLSVIPAIAKEDDITKAIERCFGKQARRTATTPASGPASGPAGEAQAGAAVPGPPSPTVYGGTAAGDQETSVEMLLNDVLTNAVVEGASDIHIEPEAGALRIRSRVDGLMREVASLPISFHPGAISRVKVLADMDIGERRLPQDGRIEWQANGQVVDLRISTIPTIRGEKAVLRILYKSMSLLGLEELGFLPEMLETFTKMLARPYGLILATGPTGSGKTTTLYGGLQKINSPDKNIVTIEDPVEYQIPGICQMPVHAKIGVTFANGLRSILRQDPDIIMVGEIRDTETAEISVQAALTGHLVFSSLHTNDAAGAVARLLDMGTEPFLLASSLTCVIAQRLVRRVCHDCRQAFTPPPRLLEGLDEKMMSGPPSFVTAKGCEGCRGTGHRGRIALVELLVMDQPIRDLIVAKASSTRIRNSATARGFRTLRQNGLILAARGVTTVEEVLRVTQDQEGEGG